MLQALCGQEVLKKQLLKAQKHFRRALRAALLRRRKILEVMRRKSLR